MPHDDSSSHRSRYALCVARRTLHPRCLPLAAATWAVFSAGFVVACDGKPAVAPARPAPAPALEPVETVAPLTSIVLPACPRFGPPREVGKVAHPGIVEASGLVASRRQRGVLWVHNDSGDGPRVYAIDESGKRLADFVLSPGSAWDWEDIAIGPGPQPGRDFLYLGDIGDNARLRRSVTIYRIAEPQIAEPQRAEPRIAGSKDRAVDIEVTNVDAFELRYPDDARDAETLLSDPATGDLFIVSKASTQIDVFRAAAPLADGTTLERVASFDGASLHVPDARMTAGDISADGTLIGVRMYRAALAWRRVGSEPVADAFARAPCVLEMPRAPGGEAFAWLPDNDGFLLVNEGRQSPLWRSDLLR